MPRRFGALKETKSKVRESGRYRSASEEERSLEIPSESVVQVVQRTRPESRNEILQMLEREEVV